MSDTDQRRDVNILRPAPGKMQSEVTEILAILLGWGGITFGFQALLRLAGSGTGESFLTKATFFNLPFHFWFTGQFLPLWFIILCILFNLYIDLLAVKHRGKRRNDYHGF